MINIKKVLAAAAAMSVIMAAGCSEDSGESSNNVVYYDSNNEYTQAVEGVEDSNGNPVNENEKVENIATVPAQIGQEAESGQLSIKINKIYDAGTIEADSDDAYGYDRQIIAVEMEMENNSDSSMNINYYEFFIGYVDGEETSFITSNESINATQDLFDDIDLLNFDLDPGEKVSAYVPLPVYSEWETLTLYYKQVDAQTDDYLTFEITKDMLEPVG